MMNTPSLFIVPNESDNAIIICDASGSVKNPYGLTQETIFRQFEKRINDLAHKNFHILFWNSNTNDAFQNGIYKLPFIVTKATLHQCFLMAEQKITNKCLTFPHLGFENIGDWLSIDFSSVIYFLTDGEIGYNQCPLLELISLKTNLSNSIKKLTDTYNLQINIITVENKQINFDQMESLQSVAGCDVYKVIHDSHLTSKIRKFTSYTPNYPNGYNHINKIQAPPGHIPYKDTYFSELRTNEFVNYIHNQIQQNLNDETQLLQIIQNLSVSLVAFQKDKSPQFKTNMTKLFCQMFTNSVIDSTIVSFMLSDAAKNEAIGSASLFANYRAQLKDLYKKATELLLQSVSDALAIQSEYITFPFNNIILTGDVSSPFQSLSPQRKLHKSAAITVNNYAIPVFPHGTNLLTGTISEQCLRQWTRSILSQTHKIDALSDMAIYVALQLTLQTVLSPVPLEVKTTYRQLALTMLRKKRLSTNATELSRLEAGDLPLPNNDKIETFYAGMNTIAKNLNLAVQPFTMWYLLCLALDNETLHSKQLFHCKAQLQQDYPDTDPFKLLEIIKIPTFTHYHIPPELEYCCLVTLDDTTLSGGFKFLPHTNINKVQCKPLQVLSAKGYELLMESPHTSLCPICYTELTPLSFEPTGPKPPILDTVIFGPDLVSPFSPSVEPLRQHQHQHQASATSNNLQVKGTLITLRGTVGCGKSTYAQHIQTHCIANNIHCLIEGVDKYSQQGDPFNVALSKIKANILNLNSIKDQPIVLIIDTCGEKFNPTDVFGINFKNTGWTIIKHSPNYFNGDLENYLSWSLRNVLQRSIYTSSTPYYLNPVSAGLQTCIDVHIKKAQALFGKKIKSPLTTKPANLEEAITLLTDRADLYATRLATNPDTKYTTWKF